MKPLKICLLCLMALLVGVTADAKKYKWEYGGMTEVYTIGQGANYTQLVNAWAVAKNADKAIEKAKMDAVSAALFNGIGYDASTHGMGVATLPPLVKPDEYKEHEDLFKNFFKKGEFLNYVRNVNSAYPTGENNMKVDGGRRVGINLVIDYPGLRNWLKENGVKKGLGDYFSK